MAANSLYFLHAFGCFLDCIVWLQSWKYNTGNFFLLSQRNNNQTRPFFLFFLRHRQPLDTQSKTRGADREDATCAINGQQLQKKSKDKCKGEINGWQHVAEAARWVRRLMQTGSNTQTHTHGPPVRSQIKESAVFTSTFLLFTCTDVHDWRAAPTNGLRQQCRLATTDWWPTVLRYSEK